MSQSLTSAGRTLAQNSHESARKHWATSSSVRSFIRTAYLLLLRSCTPLRSIIRSLARSLGHSLNHARPHGEVNH